MTGEHLRVVGCKALKCLSRAQRALNGLARIVARPSYWRQSLVLAGNGSDLRELREGCLRLLMSARMSERMATTFISVLIQLTENPDGR